MLPTWQGNMLSTRPRWLSQKIPILLQRMTRNMERHHDMCTSFLIFKGIRMLRNAHAPSTEHWLQIVLGLPSCNWWWVLIETELLNWICGHVDNVKWCHLPPGGPIVSRLNPPSSCPPCPAAFWLKFYQLWCAVYSVRSAWRNWIESERGLIRNAEIGREKKEGAENLAVCVTASLDVILW